MAKKKEYEEPIVEETVAVAVTDFENDEEPAEKTTERTTKRTKEPEKEPKEPFDIPAGACIYDHAGSQRVVGTTKKSSIADGQTVIIGGESWFKIEDGWVTHGSKNQSTTGGCDMI